MKLGIDNIYIQEMDKTLSCTYHFLKKDEVFAIDVPERFHADKDRICGKTLADCRANFIQYIESLYNLESKVIKSIWYKFEGTVQDLDGVDKRLIEPEVKDSKFRFGNHEFRGAGIDTYFNEDINRSKLAIEWATVWVIRTADGEVAETYVRDEEGRLKKENLWMREGEFVDHTPELEAFFADLLNKLDEMTKNAAHWLIQDNVLELMQSGVRLLGDGK